MRVRHALLLVVGVLIAWVLVGSIMYVATPRYPIRFNVRWTRDVDAPQRAELERQLHLVRGEPTEATTWTYWLENPSTDSIRAIVQSPRIEDTAHINRTRFRPELAQDRERRTVMYSFPIACVVVIALVAIRRLRSRSTRTA